MALVTWLSRYLGSVWCPLHRISFAPLIVNSGAPLTRNLLGAPLNLSDYVCVPPFAPDDICRAPSLEIYLTPFELPLLRNRNLFGAPEISLMVCLTPS
jgi:hypothetical protein